MTVPYGCKLGGLGATGSTSSYTTQSANQALYLGGSARAAAVPSAVQDATVYTPAAQLAAETEVEDAGHGMPVEGMHISTRMPVASESTAPRTSLWGSLGDAVSRLLDWLTPAPVVESALVLATAEGVVLGDASVSYMMATERDANIVRQIARESGTGPTTVPAPKPSTTAPKPRAEVPAWKIKLFLAPGRK